MTTAWVVVAEKNHTFTLHISTDSHCWLADEPTKMGGTNVGPDPYEHEHVKDDEHPDNKDAPALIFCLFAAEFYMHRSEAKKQKVLAI